MMLDGIESKIFDTPNFDIVEKISILNKKFDSTLSAEGGFYQKTGSWMENNIAKWLGTDIEKIDKTTTGSFFDITKQMYSGVEIDGTFSRGLKEISEMKINPDFEKQNVLQQAGWAAEVISTAKENMIALSENTGIKTFRADDRPDLFSKNDQYVDKIRVNAKGEIIERIQTKFVGKDGADCLSKLMSKSYDKYFDSGNVDKIEIPMEYFDEIKNNGLIQQKIEYFEKQLQKVTALGKTDDIIKIEAKIDRLNQIDNMIERSTVSKSEAIFARLNPEKYMKQLFEQGFTNARYEASLDAGLGAATITAAISTVENVQKIIKGETTVHEAVVDITKDTGTAGAVGAGTEFITVTVSQAMSASSHQLIQSLSNAGIPAALVSFGVDSYDSISKFAKGEIDNKQFAYELGNTAAGVTGSAIGTAAGGFVGGMVGYAIAAEAYKTAIELGSENPEILLDKAKTYANETVQFANTYIPEKVNIIKASLNDFAKQNLLPFTV